MFPLRRVLKWLGVGSGGLVIALVIAYVVVYFRSEKIVNKDYSSIPKGRALYVKSDSATVAWGKHLVRTIAACIECHGEDLGGKLVADMGPVGKLSGPNLTSGEGGIFTKDYTVADFEHTIRHGIKRDGRGINIMPSNHYCFMSDEDVAAMYAYLQTLPPQSRHFPGLELGPIGRFLFAKGIFPPPWAEIINHSAKRPAKPAVGVTVEYGQYLTRLACVGCHGMNLSGGPVEGGDPSWPPAANLSSVVRGKYTEQQFFSALREGKKPGGKAIDQKGMSINILKHLTDDELRAVYMYIQSVPEAAYASHSWRAKNMVP